MDRVNIGRRSFITAKSLRDYVDRKLQESAVRLEAQTLEAEAAVQAEMARIEAQAQASGGPSVRHLRAHVVIK